MADIDEENTLSDGFLDGDLTLGDMSGAFSDFNDGESNLDNPDDDDDEIEEDDDPDADDDEEDDEDDNDPDDKKSKDRIHGDDDEEGEWYLRAQLAKEKGELPADLEINKNISQIELEDIFATQLHDNVLKRARAEVWEDIKAAGLDPEKVFNKESDDEYMQKQYAGVAAMSYDSLLERTGDKITENVRAIGNEYYTSRSKEGLTDEEVTDLVDRDLDKLTEEEAFDKYLPHFVAESRRLAAKIKSDVNAREKVAAEKASADLVYIKSKLSSAELGLSKDEVTQVTDAFFKKDQWYDDGKTKRPVTLYEKRKLEAANSLDHQLAEAIKLILKKDAQITKEKDQRITTVNTLERLARVKPGDNRNHQKNKKNTNKRHEYTPGSFVNN